MGISVVVSVAENHDVCDYANFSDCDSPMSLVNLTLDWIKKEWVDEIDFVVWTGDSAR